jgi:hypothetical protein
MTINCLDIFHWLISLVLKSGLHQSDFFFVRPLPAVDLEQNTHYQIEFQSQITPSCYCLFRFQPVLIKKLEPSGDCLANGGHATTHKCIGESHSGPTRPGSARDLLNLVYESVPPYNLSCT